MSVTQEIERDDWDTFLREVGLAAEDSPIRVEVAKMDLGSQHLLGPLPLHELEFESKGVGTGRVLLIAGEDDEELTHHVPSLKQLFVEYRDAGDIECIELVSDDGTRTRLYFSPGVKPFGETVDAHP